MFINWSILSYMLSFLSALYIFIWIQIIIYFSLFGRILTIISSNDNALKVLGEVMGNLEDGGSVSILNVIKKKDIYCILILIICE